MVKFVYCEPIKKDTRRYKIVQDDGHQIIFSVDGVHVSAEQKEGEDFLVGPGGAKMYRETQEWLDRYQDALSMRVSNQMCTVYMCYAVRVGKTHATVVVLDAEGRSYSLRIPSVPLPVTGGVIEAVRGKLDVIAVVPDPALLKIISDAGVVLPCMQNS